MPSQPTFAQPETSSLQPNMSNRSLIGGTARRASLSRNPTASVSRSTLNASELVDLISGPGVRDLTGQLDPVGSDLVSSGKMGNLYHAKCDSTDVAIRTIRMFMVPNSANLHLLKVAANELLVWFQLDHEHIVHLMGVGCFQEQAALITPWIHHGNLTIFSKQQPSFNKLKMCIQISSGVSYLHSKHLVHGDVKAQNVLVSLTGDAKLHGFGHWGLRDMTSRFIDNGDPSLSSLRWTAPEIFSGTGQKSTATDVYALGMTILEIFTGRIPFDEVEADQTVILKILNHGIPARPRELAEHDELWGLLIRCWHHDALARPPATEVYNTLDSIASERVSVF